MESGPMTELTHRRAETSQSNKSALAGSIAILGAIAERSQTSDVRIALAALAEKLETNRLNFAILGQMKRGKSSFINALLEAEILPTGILPLTSVITRLRYGMAPAASITYKSSQSEEINCDRLHEFITEVANPGNRRQVVAADVLWPSPLLGLGIDLIDTPGIGSTHIHNTSTTEDYLGEVDAGIVVLSVDPPITAVEAEFLRRIRHHVPRLFFIVNKIDLVTTHETESVVGFLAGELRNRIGIAEPELFTVSARIALEDIHARRPVSAASGIAVVARRLEHFAAKEREQTLVESVALDVLRIARTLRLAASIGERARAMSGEELYVKKREFSLVLLRVDQEVKDLHQLMRRDLTVIVERIESDLRNHVEAATPGVRERLVALRCTHPRETRERLGTLLDEFLRSEIERVYEGWRVQEDERVLRDMAALSQRFVDRASQILEYLQQSAGSLFNVPVAPISLRSSLTVESRLYYQTEPVFKFLLDKLIFALPKPWLRRIVFRRMLQYIDVELNRNSGRIRYDYVQRVESSLAKFWKELSCVVEMVAANLRAVLEASGDKEQPAEALIGHLDRVIAQCSLIMRDPSDESETPIVSQSSMAAHSTYR